jgi:hypothetical protein
MKRFTSAEIASLQSQRLGRLATVNANLGIHDDVVQPGQGRVNYHGRKVE